jgi:ATP-binding cassette subfamily C protein
MIDFLPFVARSLRWRLALAGLVTLALALTEGTGLLLLVPLLGAIGLTVHEGTTGRVADAVTRVFEALGVEPTLVSILLLFVAVSMTRAVIQRVHVLLNPSLEQRMTVALHRRLYAAMMDARWTFFMSRRSTDLVQTLTRDVDRTSAAALQLLTFSTNLSVSAAHVLVSLWLSPGLTGLVIAGGGVVLWLMRGRSRHAAEVSEQYREADRQHFHLAFESILGIKVAKTLGAEARSISTFDARATTRAARYLELLRTYARTRLWIEIASAVLVSLLLYAAIELFAVSGAGLLVLVLAFARVLPRLTSIPDSLQVIAAAMPSYRRVMEVAAEAESQAERLSPPAGRLPLGRGIRLEHVSFTYPAAESAALDDVSLEIPVGQTVAVVGSSGAGKSTLADILLGLLLPTSGRVLVGDRPLTPAETTAWRATVGYVPQDGFMLDDTVRANLQWARPDATDQDLWRALERAAAADFIRARPPGLDTLVGERGVQLSGGERQRLALARALLTEPDVLVLDEATSALDPPNERQILEAIRQLAGRMTIVIVTHRLSAIEHADVIHVIEHGRVVESGPWQALAARSGAFSRLLLRLVPSP